MGCPIDIKITGGVDLEWETRDGITECVKVDYLKGAKLVQANDEGTERTA